MALVKVRRQFSRGRLGAVGAGDSDEDEGEDEDEDTLE
jgi:hypothetical protein